MERIADLLRDLVRTPSHPGLPRQEEAVVAVLARWLAARGVLAHPAGLNPMYAHTPEDVEKTIEAARG